MTQLSIALAVDAPGGRQGVPGLLTATAQRIRTDDATVIIPGPVDFPIAATGTTVVNLDSPGPDWSWHLKLSRKGGTVPDGFVRIVAPYPNMDTDFGTVDFEDGVAVVAAGHPLIAVFKANGYGVDDGTTETLVIERDVVFSTAPITWGGLVDVDPRSRLPLGQPATGLAPLVMEAVAKFAAGDPAVVTAANAAVATAAQGLGIIPGATVKKTYTPTIAAEGYGALPSLADNSAVLNQALAVANSGVAQSLKVTLYTPGVYTIADHLIIYSNTHLELGPGVTIKKVANAENAVCMLRNANMLGNDREIEISGGTWDGNAVNNMTRTTTSDKTNPQQGVQGDLSLITVDGLRIHDTTITQCNGFAIQALGKRIRIRNISWGAAGTRRDGVHLNAPSSDVLIENIEGWSHDDFVALNAWDWIGSAPSFGDITDVVIRNLNYKTITGTDVTGAFVKFLPGTRGTTRCEVRRVDVSNLTGRVSGSPAFHFFSDIDPAGNVPSGAGLVTDVSIRNVNRILMTNSNVLFNLGVDIENLHIDDVRVNSASTGEMVMQAAGKTARSVRLSRFVVDSPWRARVQVKGTVTDLYLSNSDILGADDGSDLGIVDTNSGGLLRNLFVNNVRQTNGGALFYSQSNASGAETTRVYLSNYVGTNLKRVFFSNKPLIVQAVASSFLGVKLDVIRTDTTAFTGTFRACDATYAAGAVMLNRVNSSPTRLIASDLPVDLSKVSLRQAGDDVMNSNAALSCGVGRVTSDGTSWKNLYSGATYAGV